MSCDCGVCELDDRISELISDCGWTQMGIVDPDGEIPSMGYTVGLWGTWGHPELLTLGMPIPVANEIFHIIVEEYIKTGKNLKHGQTLHKVGNLPLAVRKIRQEAVDELMLVVNRRYGEGEFDALMLVWPDPEGRFPWDEGYDHEKWDNYQPMVWED